MQASAIPSKIQLPFASSGTKNTIPIASQIGITPGAASYTTGFPPLTFTDLAAGGVPPAGADFNGVLNAITAVQQWQSAGGVFRYDSAFSTAIGGYPKGAILQSADEATLWLNLADNNTTDPDGSTPANWAPASSYGIAAITGLTNANVTLTPAQYSRPIITLAGTLTGNVQIIFPTTSQEWIVVNNTTGAFIVTCKTASGTGAAVAQASLQQFFGDGINLVPMGISQSAADARYAALAYAQQIKPIAAAVASNALTATLNATALDFRSATLSSGTVNTRTVSAPISLVVPSGATLGTVSGQASRLVLLAIDNAGAVELAIANLAGGSNLDETTLISTTAISGTSNSASAIYSTTARGNVPFRVVGLVDSTQATAGTWAAAPSAIQGAGGVALAALQSVGYGQTLQNPTRTLGTTYYNTTGRPIFLSVGVVIGAAGNVTQLTVNGTTMNGSSAYTGSATSQISFLIPPGASYSVTGSGSGNSLGSWIELR